MLVAAMLSIVMVAVYFAWPGWVSILVLSKAMGILNISITHVGAQSVGLGYVTGDLNNLGQQLALGIKRAPIGKTPGSGDAHWLRAAVLAGIWTAIFAGAIVGAALASRSAYWTLLLPVILLMVFALLEN